MPAANAMYTELVEYIARSLVDSPDKVVVRETQTGNHFDLELTVAEGDVGRVIGRGGRVVNAIRTLLEVPASQRGHQVSLEIL